MALDVQYISLDISKQPTPQQVRLGQGDANATQLVVSVFDDGIAYSLDNYSVRLEMRLPNSDNYYSVDGTRSGNVATFDIDETYAATSYGFDGFGYVDILSGDTVICSTSRFQLVVLQNAQEGADPSTAYSNGIIEATERAIAAAEAAEGVVLQDVPLMSSNIRGGAKLGVGLDVSDGRLNVDLSDSASGSSVLTNGCALLDVEGDGWAEQDGTPTPENPVPIRVAKGRNLLLNDNVSGTTNGITFTLNDDCSVTVNGTATAETRFYLIRATTPERFTIAEAIKNGASFTMSTMTTVPTGAKLELAYYQDNTYAGKINNVASGASSTTFSAPSVNFDNVRVYILVNNGATINNVTFYPQLEAGSTVTPYVPYGHVGLEIRQGSTLVDCIPVPIPEEGLAALPDGTHDTLSIDSAGHVVVEKKTHEYTITGNETVLSNASIGTNYRVSISIADPSENLQVTGSPRLTQYCSHAIVSWSWNTDVTSVYVGQHGDSLANKTAAILKYPASAAADVINAYIGATVLYKLNTPQTIDLGYIDLPLMPDGCTVSIPELHKISAEWVVTRAEAIPEMVSDVRKWALHEIALAGDAELSTIAAVENATASTNYAMGSYLVHAGILYRVTTAIATGETITPGGNVTATTVMAELIRLTA